MAQIVGSPGGWLWVVDDQRHQFDLLAAHKVSASMPSIESQDPLVKFIDESGWLVDLEEFKREPQLYGELALPQWVTETEDAWLIVPLQFRHELLGLVMLTKASALFDLNYEDRDLLKTVGNHLAVHLAQEQTDNRLAEAQQFDAYNRLTAFLMHDLSNLVAQLSLIIENAEKHKRNPEFVDDAMRTIANSVTRMKRVLSRLKHRDAAGRARLTELRFIVSAAADRCAEYEPVPVLDFGAPGIAVNVDAEQIITVVSHLIKNAQDATASDGQVSVRVLADQHSVSIEIEDSGCGMSPQFLREHLFKPFDSTKGSQGMGIGAYQAREFARSRGGELSVESEESRGTKVTLTLPLM
jgi:putative PEP-CTERM system histidine kinase